MRILAATLPFFFSISLSAEILIYDGPGACKGCAALIRSILRNAGHTARIVSPGEVNAATLKNASLYIQPGGKNTMHVRKAVGEDGLAEIKNFVQGGGKYLGLCLGGTLGSTGPDDEGQMLALLPVRAYESGDPRSKLVDLDIEGGFGRRKVYVQDPPDFTPLVGSESKIRVLAKYADGRAAAVRGAAGRGEAILVGPHFEADGWGRASGLKDPDGDDHKVFVWLVNELIGAPSAATKRPAKATPREFLR